jgi:peptidoglycan/xylan/chitin deacetylase (PgdA/CDA1 family)
LDQAPRQKRVDRSLRVLAKWVFSGVDLFLGSWPGPRILIYHQLTDQPSREMDVSPEMFAGHVEWLWGRGRFVDLESALADPERDDSSHRHVLTFDDGYSGVLRHAYPILERRGIPFTLYVTSGLIENAPGDDADVLRWDEINRMQESGLVTIGAHTHTHPDLRTLSTDQVQEELETSNELIEKRTGVRPRHFAYPKGYWSGSAEPVVRSCYATATLGAGPPITSATDPHRVSRVPVQLSDGHLLFKRKLERGMRMEEWLRAKLKGYRNPSDRIEGW